MEKDDNRALLRAGGNGVKRYSSILKCELLPSTWHRTRFYLSI